MTQAWVDCHETVRLASGWEAAWAPPSLDGDPRLVDGLDWLPARVPGTAAAALLDAGLWRPHDRRDLDAEDWWFRARLPALATAPGDERALVLEGVATVADVWLDGAPLLQANGMFTRH